MSYALLVRLASAGFCLAISVASVAPCRAADAEAKLTLGSVDTYGSELLSSEDVKREFTEDFRQFVEAMTRLDGSRIKSIEEKVLASVRARGPFAYAEIAAIQSAAPRNRVDFTIDLVEQQDAPRRMPFRHAPTQNFSDPDGLLRQWAEFERTALPIAMAGKLGNGEDCPVWHCAFSFNDPALLPYLDVFNRGARKHKQVLARIALKDADPEHRKYALYLLVHAGDGTRLVRVIERAIFDPSASVRNAALRILMMMIPHMPQLRYPIADLVLALDFPATTDRNKAGWALVALGRDERNLSYIRAHALPTLLKLLQLEQPINHEPAYELLKLVSGESFGARDYESWRMWTAQVSR